MDFRGLGQEPGWYLEIDDGAEMRFVYDNGGREVTTVAPRPIIFEDTTTYAARSGGQALTVLILGRPCTDVMSGAAFPNTVTITLDDMTYRGCGRSLAPAGANP